MQIADHILLKIRRLARIKTASYGVFDALAADLTCHVHDAVYCMWPPRGRLRHACNAPK